MSSSPASQQPEIAGPTPPRVAPFVAALGASAAIDFLLSYGGQLVHLPTSKGRGGTLRRELGAERAAALTEALGSGPKRVPLAKEWIARQLEATGHSRAEIATKLHVTRESVRRYLAKPAEAA